MKVSLDALLAEREQMIEKHAQELEAIEAVLADNGWFAPGVRGGRKSIRHSAAKIEQYQARREQAIKRGFVKPNGLPDLELLRLTLRAEKDGITVAEVAAREIKARKARADAKFKTVGKAKR
jgi:hypothetical protein